MKGIRTLLQQATRLVLPNCCILCGCNSHSGRDLCAICESKLPWNHHCCQQCALPFENAVSAARICGQCQHKPPAFDRLIAPLRYDFPVDHLINGFKHKHRFHYGRILVEILAQALLQQQAAPAVDRVIPVPLHWRREFLRGYNQADWLAVRLGRELQRPIERTLIKRTAGTPAQQGLKRKQRLANLKNAFQIHGKLNGASVALVDDVVTTGSTADTLSKLLKQNGASQVQVWCLARTPHRVNSKK